MSLICAVFKSPNIEDMYLYVEKSQGMKRVPEQLLKRFGQALPVMTLLLTVEKKLARVEVADVIQQIKEQGYFLQMPVAKHENFMAEHQQWLLEKSDET